MKLDFLGLNDAAELCFDSGYRSRNRFAAGRWQLGLMAPGEGTYGRRSSTERNKFPLLRPSLTTSGHVSEGVDVLQVHL